ncbi:3-oxoacyl-[acyl-carrier-protein] reductase FabG [Bradyrhizobium ivorense]|uniref:3-oxoacyl-[acyl-carrier-protein] reductase FabG n=1 Tax=Bradyrhizobium ivorense TaxID=2511166 RepID=A0A508TCU0_9BRAD|nr:SDR family oxidoreductase [Bradyrhizobium ivorense]VIO73262.1 3-oxoacyl-[acyl-carrier-protein] reductase FabG [Bradyrhizobium ivorense]
MTRSVAIVTGASSGIGRATALRLARDFTAIVLVARGGGKLREVGQQCEAGGATPLLLELDLASPKAAETVVKATLDHFGRIDALVNVAGAVPGLDLFEMTDEQWDAGLALKMHGARRLTIRAWEALKASQGAVIFTSGNAAVLPRAGAAAVGAINAAIEALAKAFAERGIDDGVQVNCVSPGAVITGRRLAMLEKAAAAKGITLDAAKAVFLKQAGIKRFGTPEEIADLTAFAISPAARWMTGTVLRMDGGEIRSV